MTQLFQPEHDDLAPRGPQKTEELGSAPPQTEHLAADSLNGEPTEYSTQPYTAIQAEIPIAKPEVDTPWYKTRLAKVGAAIIAGASLLGIGTRLGGGNDKADVRSVATAEPSTPTSEVPAPSTTEAASNTTIAATSDSREVIRDNNGITVERSNDERIHIEYITDADVQNGQAAYILKEMSGLFMTTGDERLLQKFVYKPEEVESVDSWRHYRQATGVEDANTTGGDAVLKYDVRNMRVDVIYANDSTAKLFMINDQDLYAPSFVDRWDEVEFHDYDKVNYSEINNAGGHYANFYKVGNYWMFTGFTTE